MWFGEVALGLVLDEAPVWSVAAPLVVVVADESGGVAGLALVLPVVELFVCVEFDWSLLVCGVVELVVEGDPTLFELPVPLTSVVDWVAVVPPFCPVGVLADGTAVESVVVLLFI